MDADEVWSCSGRGDCGFGTDLCVRRGRSAGGSERFAKGSTYTALLSGHGAECPKKIQNAFKLLIESGDENDKIYLDVLKHTFKACDDIESPCEVAEWRNRRWIT